MHVAALYDSAMAFAGGEVFAGFTVVRLLGSGGMGEVYLARHPRLPREDALKVLPESLTADDEFRRRFVREADTAATLWHPHIVRVYDRGEFEGRLWIAMDYVEGTDAARLSREQFPAGRPTADVVAIVTPVAEALDYAHERGLLHRDVKPANILLTIPTKGQRRALLADFGIARHADDVTGLTATNMTVGSVSYTAPEQLMGEELDGRVDQYALAATAFHLLTGSPPFPHSNPAVVISRHISTPPPAPGDRKPQLRTLDAVIATALAKNPAGRYDTCSDFADALAQKSASAAPVVAPVVAALPSPHLESSAVSNAADEPTAKREAPPVVVSSWGATDEAEDDSPDNVDAPPPPPAPPTSQARKPALAAAAVAVAVGLVATITFVLMTTGDAEDSATTAAPPTSTEPTITQQPPPTPTPPPTRTIVQTKPPVTVTVSSPPPPPPPPQPRPSRPPAVPSGDLGLSKPMSYPKCNGQGIVIVESVDTPGEYRERVQRLLDANPGSYYLRTDLTCPSLRARNERGNPIYAVFYPGGTTLGQLCAAENAAGTGAYARILDYQTDPGFDPC